MRARKANFIFWFLRLFPSFVIVSVLFLDWFSKKLAVGQNYAICNKGFAFGLSGGFLNTFLYVAAIGVTAFFFWKQNRLLEKVALALILGGGLANILDRLTRGCVVDFINLRFFPSFNLADLVITVGVFLLIAALLVKDKTNIWLIRR